MPLCARTPPSLCTSPDRSLSLLQFPRYLCVASFNHDPNFPIRALRLTCRLLASHGVAPVPAQSHAVVFMHKVAHILSYLSPSLLLKSLRRPLDRRASCRPHLEVPRTPRLHTGGLEHWQLEKASTNYMSSCLSKSDDLRFLLRSLLVEHDRMARPSIQGRYLQALCAS